MDATGGQRLSTTFDESKLDSEWWYASASDLAVYAEPARGVAGGGRSLRTDCGWDNL